MSSRLFWTVFCAVLAALAVFYVFFQWNRKKQIEDAVNNSFPNAPRPEVGFAANRAETQPA
jgi:hypothetical protein